ncbi:unnamed protein product [Parnassius apollo]|uniref:(apollo) hypothetical protein n=1 Tax=Parnassius apollo TaxID=110799 RepID=A0A8S3Y9E6_PARAO|nr:unnamed protein product [Parnassius apollo]
MLKEHTINHKSIDLEKFIPQRVISKDVPVKIDVAEIACKVCSTDVSNVDELIAHIVSQHDQEYDGSNGVCVFPFVLNRQLMQCVLCDDKYDNFTCILAHMFKKHIEHRYICQICGLSFIDQVRLKRHINNSHNGYRCKICGKLFDAFHKLDKHKQRIHGQVRSHGCSLCSATFASPYQVKVHMGKVHNVEKYRIQCEHCPKICTTKGAMLLHVQSLHSDAKYECDLCEYRTGIKWMLKLHKRRHFGEPRGGQKTAKQLSVNINPPISEEETIPIAEMITQPKLALTSKGRLKIMRNNVLQVLLKSTVMPFRWLKSSYRCFYCYDIFQESSELKDHQQIHIGDNLKEQAMNNYWEQVVYIDISNMACKLCPEKINDLYDLIDHLVDKHDVVYNKDIGVCMVAFKLDNFAVNCLACGASFYTFGPLLHHTNKDHKGISAILCEVCGQNFKDANLLRLHVKTVHENTGVLCPECGVKFETRSKLKTHQKNQHDLDKKYKCLVCTQTFQSHYKRSRHMAAEHKNKQEVKCLHCPKTFVFRSMMMTHLRDTHLKVRNHVCGVCGWKAFNSNRLKNHMYKHSGEKNFKCEACDKAFTTKKIMRAHYARMHKVVQQQVMPYDNPYAGHQ